MNLQNANAPEGDKNGKPMHLRRIFVITAGAMLACTAVAKVWSAFGNANLLGVADPILGIQFRHVILGAGLVEFLAALVCFYGRTYKTAVKLIAWLATNFAVYRFGLWWIGWERPCACLGSLTDAIHISPQLADNIMKVVLSYLLIGSYGLLFWQWREGRKSVRFGESLGASVS
jgi:hypothetical protein